MAASEAYPYSKSGGLADVMGALPKYLGKMKNEVSLVLPLYASTRREYLRKMEKVMELEVTLNWRNQYCGVWKLKEEDLTCYFIENDYYFNRENYYGYYDDGERFIFFSKAVTALIEELEEKPDIVHTHDWQTALINIYLKNIKTVFTIHNLRYQGRFPGSVFDDLIDLPEIYFKEDALEYYGDVNLMKGGVIFADQVTTVSPNYSREIKDKEFGEGLDGVLLANSYKLKGILNGLDYDEYNPYTDKALYYNFRNSRDLKLRNKEKLQESYKLEINRSKPLLTLVSRFTEQKGLDLLIYIMDELLKKNIQLIIHGNGEKYYEDALRKFVHKYPDNYRLIQGFKEESARKIYAGGDIFLMPSLFEPCGISQMIALSYGSIPLVREAGGLKDTITPYNEFTGEGNGFSFANYNGDELLKIIEYALEVYRDQQKWKILFKNALKAKFTWEKAAGEYMEIYQNLIKKG
jgi:starch synthase